MESDRLPRLDSYSPLPVYLKVVAQKGWTSGRQYEKFPQLLTPP